MSPSKSEYGPSKKGLFFVAHSSRPVNLTVTPPLKFRKLYITPASVAPAMYPDEISTPGLWSVFAAISSSVKR